MKKTLILICLVLFSNCAMAQDFMLKQPVYPETNRLYTEWGRAEASKQTAKYNRPTLWVEYMKKVEKQIKANWHVPLDETRPENKRTVVSFTVLRDGTMENLKIKTSSGNEAYDKYAMDAVKKAAPFEKLPETFKGKSVDIEFVFDLNVHEMNPIL